MEKADTVLMPDLFRKKNSENNEIKLEFNAFIVAIDTFNTEKLPRRIHFTRKFIALVKNKTWRWPSPALH